MTVKQIYSEYLLPENLQHHMLRVAGLAQIITTDQNVILACLFHDIAKPINFDLAKQARFGMSPADISELAGLQIRLVGKFGPDEHQATVGICREIGLNPQAVKLVDNLEWKYIPELLQLGDPVPLIPIYCDMRIGPKGILSLSQRIEDLKSRAGEEDFDSYLKNGLELEHMLQSQVSLDLNTITNADLESQFNQLLATSL
jgi:hypothetical protein